MPSTLIKQNLCGLVVAVVVHIGLLSINVNAQSREAVLYRKLKEVNVFKTTRAQIEAIFHFHAMKESRGGEASRTVYYELEGARLEVYYSLGTCAEHQAALGYNVSKETVIGVDLRFRRDLRFSALGIDLREFRRYQEFDNDSIIYSNDVLGMAITGDKKRVSSIEISGSALEQQRYGCRSSKAP